MEITKQDVENIIEIRKKNTFLTHLGLFFYGDLVYYGEVKRSEIFIWSQNYFHTINITPVFTFKFNANNHLVEIKSSLNPLTKFLLVVMALFIGFLFLPQNIYQTFNSYWKPVGLLFAFFSFLF